ncbi:MAG: hypothetical protein JXB47_02900 [Anaerolineae bacterium]|nr:hypothetical protein [Anaerolineae bacterium]
MKTGRWQVSALLAVLIALSVAGCDLIDFAASTGAPITRVTLEEKAAMGGSFGGETYLTVTIDAMAGTFTVERRDADPVGGVLPVDYVEQLSTLLDEADFYHLDEAYLTTKSNCCGMVSYIVTVEKGDHAFSVTASDDGMPEGYGEIVRFVEALTE